MLSSWHRKVFLAANDRYAVILIHLGRSEAKLNGKWLFRRLRCCKRPGHPESLRGSLTAGTRREGVKDLAQAAALVNSLDDVVRSTWLWVKLYAG